MYGVDQCRRCGIKINPMGAFARNEFLALKGSRTGMSEPEWRKLGLLAAPTPRQLKFPALGCCFECGMILQRRKTRPFLRLGKAAALCFVAFAIIWTVGTYVSH